MPEVISTGFGCKACGRRFAWKPALAGKRVKCSCGNVLTVPATAPAVVARPAAVAHSAPPPGAHGGMDLSALEEAAIALRKTPAIAVPLARVTSSPERLCARPVASTFGPDRRQVPVRREPLCFRPTRPQPMVR